MRSQVHFLGLALAAFSFGCDGARPVGPGPTGPFNLTTASAWAGTAVTVTSADFKTHGSGALLLVSGDTVALGRVDDTTLSARLPITVGGVVTPTLVVDGVQFALSPLTLNGFVEYREYSPQLPWDIYAWPRSGPAQVMGGSDEGLTIINLDAGTVTSFPGLINLDNLHGPGFTYRDSVFVLVGDSGRLETWRVLPTPVKLDTLDQGVLCYCRQAMQLGPNTIYVASGGVGWGVASRPDSTQPYAEVVKATGAISETEGAYLSPTHDRATMSVDHLDGGIPVFNAPAGTLAYTVTRLQSGTGVDFSPDGQLLAMTGRGDDQTIDDGRLLLLNAQTGQVLGDSSVNRMVFGAAIDPVRPLVYFGASSPEARLEILVFDRNTFHLVAELGVPNSAPACNTQCYKSVIALSSANALYLVASYGLLGTQVYKFTLPPP